LKRGFASDNKHCKRFTFASSPRTFQGVVIEPQKLLLEVSTSLTDRRAIFSFLTRILHYRMEPLTPLLRNVHHVFWSQLTGLPGVFSRIVVLAEAPLLEIAIP